MSPDLFALFLLFSGLKFCAEAVSITANKHICYLWPFESLVSLREYKPLFPQKIWLLESENVGTKTYRNLCNYLQHFCA